MRHVLKGEYAPMHELHLIMREYEYIGAMKEISPPGEPGEREHIALSWSMPVVVLGALPFPTPLVLVYYQP